MMYDIKNAPRRRMFVNGYYSTGRRNSSRNSKFCYSYYSWTRTYWE
jgi:hypothetical protein